MGKRLFLPVTHAAASERPTVDAIRKKLGGRAETEAGAGEILSFRGERGLERTGVALFVRGEEIDLWMDGDLVRRVRRGDVRAADGAVSDAVFAVARDALAFADLREGQRVRFQHASGEGEGTIIEKCRFGALVERGDHTVLGVGFRRLSAA